MDAQWSDDFHHALFGLLTDERTGYYADFGSMAQLAKSLTSAFVYGGEFSIYRDRNHGRPVDGLSTHRFLGYIQNHDQVGNRALGERLHHIANLDRAMLAAALVLTSPFVPMIFQGEEFAASSPFLYFADHDDPGLAQAVSKGRRMEFAALGLNPESVPDPEDQATFECSKLRWNELHAMGGQHHAQMSQWYRDLIRLRRQHPSLHAGVTIRPRGRKTKSLNVSFNEERAWLKMRRGDFTILCNLGTEIYKHAMGKNENIVLSNRASLSDRHLLLQPDGVAIVSAAGLPLDR